MPNIKKQEYYRKNREKRLEYQREYYEQNKERIKKNRTTRMAKEPERIEKEKRYNREYYEKHKHEIMERRKRKRADGKPPTKHRPLYKDER
jgi:hypothetical protein